MHQLLLVRHGHAVEKTGQTDDINRLLSSAGEQEAIHAAELLQQQGLNFQRIYVSPAKRTLKTGQIIADILGAKIELQPTLYLASTADLLTFIDTFSEDWESVLLVGHNPGLSECAALLAKQNLPELKTGGAHWLQWEQETWEDIANGISHNVKTQTL